MNTKDPSRTVIAKHWWEADHNWSCDQKKVVIRESRLIHRKIKETTDSLRNLNRVNKISHMLPEIWVLNLRWSLVTYKFQSKEKAAFLKHIKILIFYVTFAAIREKNSPVWSDIRLNITLSCILHLVCFIRPIFSLLHWSNNNDFEVIRKYCLIWCLQLQTLLALSEYFQIG